MTSSIDLATLGFGVDEHRRDQWGRMKVVPPGGREPIGYTRVTTVAKALDDGGGLAPWKAALSIVGLFGRPGLRDRWQALIAASRGDPWYFSAASKSECKRLVEQCSEAGGSTDRAEQGTSLHALTALVDVGHDVTGLLPETQDDIDAYVEALIAEGITIATNASNGLPCVELTTVLDDYRVAGTADRVVHVPGFDQPLIADLKTGTDLGYSWNAIAVQLAAYAHGDVEYWQGPDPNGSEDMRSAMPDVDQRHGLIIHLPAGEARCELYVIDLLAGWEAFKLSVQARAWRARRDLSVSLPPRAQRIQIIEPPTLTLAPALPVESAGAIAAALLAVEESPWNVTMTTAADVVGVVEPFTTGHEQAQLDATPPVDLFAALDAARDRHPTSHLRAVQAPQSDAEVVELRQWLQARVDVAGRHAAAGPDLVAHWPAAIPPLKASAGHTVDQLATIEGLLDDVEARHSIPFGPTRPDHSPEPERWTDRLLGTFPNTMTQEHTS